MPLVAHILETDELVVVTGGGEGDPTGVDWDEVLTSAWAVIVKMRSAGIPLINMTVIDLEARVP